MANLKAVPDGWEAKQFADAITLSYGKSPKEILVEDGVYPVIGTGGITGYTNSYLHEGFTTVIGRKGSINNPSFIVSRFWAIDTTYIASNYNNTDAKWFFYLLQSINLTQYNEASGVPSLNRDTLYGIPFILPPLPEQQKIAAILTSVDEVVEKTQAQIDKLKDLKTAMMQELLLPSENGGVGTSADVALNNSTAGRESYIPHTEFKDSPVGRIPKSWEVVKLDDVALIVDSMHQTPTFSDVGMPMVRVTEIRQNDILDISGAMLVDDKTFNAFSKNYKPNAGDTLIARVGAYFGATAYINSDYEFCLGQNTASIRPKNILPEFVFLCLNSENVRSQMNDAVAVGAQPSLSLKAIKELKVVRPSLQEQKVISESINSVAKKISIVQSKLHQFKNTKKALMQDLLTGKVRVKVD